MKKLKPPSVEDVATDLRAINEQELEPDDAEEGIDVRLQVISDEEAYVHSGDAQYDQDHSGYWGAATVPGGGRPFDAVEVAQDLIDQVLEDFVTGEAPTQE